MGAYIFDPTIKIIHLTNLQGCKVEMSALLIPTARELLETRLAAQDATNKMSKFYRTSTRARRPTPRDRSSKGNVKPRRTYNPEDAAGIAFPNLRRRLMAMARLAKLTSCSASKK